MMDKTLEIKRIGNRPVSAADVVSLLDAAGIAPVRLDSANWSESFPYKPEVNFRIGHTGDAILIAWTANEKNVRGVASDNGAVWEDPCVEFFISFNGGDSYYNIECNCRGGMLCGHGAGKTGRVNAPTADLDQVSRHSSLGPDAFETRPADGPWHLAMIIPLSLFGDDAPDSLDGIVASGNFYKCGDALPDPHFLSWSPVKVDSPNFHLPEFFGKIVFD